MAKKPKGLVEAEKAAVPAQAPEFDLNKLMILDESDSWVIFRNYPDLGSMHADLRYQAYDVARQLASQIASESLGVSHASDLLDNSIDSIYFEFANYKKNKAKYIKSSSDDYSDESSSDYYMLDRHDYYDQVKENFKSKLDDAIGEGSLIEFEAFKTLFKMAKKRKFKGTEQEFENLLKSSVEFRQLCKNATTDYTG